VSSANKCRIRPRGFSELCDRAIVGHWVGSLCTDGDSRLTFSFRSSGAALFISRERMTKSAFPWIIRSPSAITLSIHLKGRIMKKSPHEYQGKPSQRPHSSKELALRDSYFVLLDNGQDDLYMLEKCNHFLLKKHIEFDLKSPFIAGLLVHS
jgi:hypothetical protein